LNNTHQTVKRAKGNPLVS